MYGKSYIVLGDQWLSDLVISVNLHIELGYIPMGGICIDNGTYYQALYKDLSNKHETTGPR